MKREVEGEWEVVTSDRVCEEAVSSSPWSVCSHQ